MIWQDNVKGDENDAKKQRRGLSPSFTAQDVAASFLYADGIAAMTGLPVRFTCCAAPLAADLAPLLLPGHALFPLEIRRLYYQLKSH